MRKNNARRPDLGQSGQSIIEFALAMTITFGILLFFIQLSLVLSFGNYVQYATFMSARALLSGGLTSEDQTSRATRVLARMVKKGENRQTQDKLPMIARGFGGGPVPGGEIGSGQNFDPHDYNLSWMEGVRYTFRSRLFGMPLGRASASDPKAGYLTLTSESWLGRSPTYEECRGAMKKEWLIDNGC